jgi:hypothetical protein
VNGTEHARDAVADLVLPQIVAAFQEEACRLVAFPRRARKQVMQAVPRLVQIELGARLGSFAVDRLRELAAGLDLDRTEILQPSDQAGTLPLLRRRRCLANRNS